MRVAGIVITVLLLAPVARAGDSTSDLWNELQTKREKLASSHQEFEVLQTYHRVTGNQSTQTKLIIDTAPGRWREKSVAGSSTRIRIFDGANLFSMEEGDDEFIAPKHPEKEGELMPALYRAHDADWAKTVEVERIPCKVGTLEHRCVTLDAPLKPWMRGTSDRARTRMLQGSVRVILDMETGLVFSTHKIEAIETSRGTLQSETVYKMLRIGYGKPADPSLFKVPEGAREVKEFSRWDAPKIKKQLAGQTAPELTVTDISGKPLALSAFKGKTVLIDFWTTWCGPCRADAPALDKLYRKYGAQDLMIVGVNVNEDRATVEKFLGDHPHGFPVVLTSENEMPRPYQIGLFPTYIVIGRDGMLESAVQGTQGFGELQHLLKKAGLDIE